MEYIFSFDFSVGFEGNNKFTKKVLSRHGMRWRWNFHFRCVTNKIHRVYFASWFRHARSNRHEFIRFCEYLLCVKANVVNCLAVSSQGVQRPERVRICRECKDYVIGREMSTELKITVDNAILELCDSCDFPALWSSDVVSTEINESSRTALESALRSSKTFFHHKLVSEHM